MLKIPISTRRLRDITLPPEPPVMADPEQLALLKQGVDAWNAWRKENSEVIPDLREADLQKVNLEGANLSGADLKRAILGDTSFGNTRLADAKNLEECIHEGPSNLDRRTLAKNLHLPEAFLRGCGLSDADIEYAKLYRPDLTNNQINDIVYRIFDLRATRAIQINPLFISYSHPDGAFVDRVEKKLDDKGIRFWRDIHHATAGRLEKQVDRAIRHNPTVLLVLSQHSVESDWVEYEAQKARDLEKELGRDVLCPVALDGSWETCVWEGRLRRQIEKYHILDFAQWKNAATFDAQFARLLRGLHLFYEPEDKQ